MKSYGKATAMLKEFEGSVPYMYLDTRGLVTVGVGHMIPSAADAKKLKFFHRKGRKHATPDEIATEYDRVDAMDQGHAASFYGPSAQLEMHQHEITSLLMHQIRGFETKLKANFPQFDTYPEDAQLGLLDMAYNLGTSKLISSFPTFCKAVKARDWKTAAAECHRNGPSDERNNKVKQLFLNSAKLDQPHKTVKLT